MKKKIVLSFAILILLSTVIVCASKHDRQIAVKELPAAAQKFIKTHFGSNAKVLYAEKEWTKYETRVSGGYEVDFYTDGTWKSVEAKRDPIPASIVKLLPVKIQSYISANYKGWIVTDVSKKRHGFELELVDVDSGSDIEIKFNREGEIIKIDY